MPPSKSFHFDVSVREWVDFVLRRGDLRPGPDFTSPKRALEGTLGHQQLQSSRPAFYRAEIPLKWEVDGPGFQLTVKGRIDGVMETPEGLVLEEIKTVTGDWNATPSPLHWAQLRIYGGLWNKRHPPAPLHLRLTYFHLETAQETCFDEHWDPDALEAFLEDTLKVYLDWLKLHVQRLHRRDASLDTMDFPFARHRPGQDQMLASVEKLHRGGGALTVEAPTGIGKTMGSLFPSLKALLDDRIKQVMILSARSPGQLVFLEALELLEKKGAHLRVLHLTAREKICRHRGAPCDPMLCSKRIGYFDRIHEARVAAQTGSTNILDAAALEAIGERFQICPHAFANDMVPWADVLIGDYNYAFDPEARLSSVFGDEAARKQALALLVDESHNLADRGREMFSQQLNTEDWTQAVQKMKGPSPVSAQLLRVLWKEMRSLFRAPGQAADAINDPPAPEQTELFPNHAEPVRSVAKPGMEHVERRVAPDLLLLTKLPESWQELLESFLERTERYLRETSADQRSQEVLELFFEVHSFCKALRQEGDEHRLILEKKGRHIHLRRYCLDPSKALAAVWTRAWSTVFFSATLSPRTYYRPLLGIPSAAEDLQLTSPFSPSNWEVVVHQTIATTYRQRAYSYRAIGEAILALQTARKGNYLVYFPSYSYLQAVSEIYRELLSSSTEEDPILLEQTPSMTEAARKAFLESFRKNTDGTCVGFAVMGGIFGEGVDLVGEHLIGVVVVGVGLPQVCMERDLIREYFESTQGQGFDFAYRYPGMGRVMQAVGRLIRSETDRGIAVLIDHRFGQNEYRKLLPDHWPVRSVQRTEDMHHIAKAFWNRRDSV